MNRIIKYISVYLLWLAWLVMTAHMMIPHDHHFVDSITGKGDKCPVSNDQTDHHSGFPLHCHACNDLTSEKATIMVLKDRIQFNDLYFSDFTDIIVSNFRTTQISIFDSRESFPDSYLLESSLLRAPPLSV